MGRNILIEASAGTGKTYRLVTHFLELLDKGVRPESIVALTFSRAAAGEIFDSLVERLVKGKDYKRLRELIRVQHLCSIGTIDSFLMKIIRSFPLELGLGGAVSILGDYERSLALQDSLERALAVDQSDATELMRTILTMFAASGKKSLAEALDRVIDELLDFYADHLDKRWGLEDAGGVASRTPGERAARHRELAEQLRQAGACFESLPKQQEAFAAIVDFVAAFNGRFSQMATPVKNLLEAIDFENSKVREFTLNRKKVLLEEEPAQTVLCVFRELLAETMAILGVQSAAMGRFLKRVYDAYCKNWTEQGRITFGDMPRLIARLPEDAKLAVEYRFDSKFEHWALDEFQDTNHPQWNALRNLIDEAMQADSERSVFVVGDVKQAIYGWRGGAVEIFKGEIASPAYVKEGLDDSKRYGQAISEVINDVFGNIGSAVESTSCEAAKTWQELWREHSANHQFTDAGCFICKEVGEAEEGEADKCEQCVRLIDEELRRIGFKDRQLSCAVLVRSGKDGIQLAQELRNVGYRAVFEGDTGIFDVPAVAYLAELAAWAEHPASDRAENLFKISPLNGVELAAPRAFLRSVTRIGLARTYRALIESLPEEAVKDKLVKIRLEELVRAAAKFEAAFGSELRLDAFRDFLEQESVGNVADSSAIAVMTIHHSKGLSKDVVFLPVLETFGMDKSSPLPIVAGNCILKRPDQSVIKAEPELADYERGQDASRIFEELCVNYVSFTRARRELFVILPPPPKKQSKALKFSNILRDRLGGDYRHGELDWYSDVKKRESSADGAAIERKPRSVSKRTIRSVPSAAEVDFSATELFRKRAGAASERGSDYHRKMEQIEFDDCSYGGALRRPENFTGLWRECPYEFYDAEKDRWESGVFDRVVFTGDGAERCATVFDFKTNTPRGDESEEQFISRMRQSYSMQLRAYRRAVAALSNIDKSKVRTVLLLEKLDRAVELFEE